MEKVEGIKTAVQSHEVPELYQISLTQSGRCEGCMIASWLRRTSLHRTFNSGGIAVLSESGFYITTFRGNDEQTLAKDGAFTSSEGVNVRSWQRRSTALVTAFLDTTTAQKLACSDSYGFRAYARSPATRLLVYELLAPAFLTLHSAYLENFRGNWPI